MMRKLLAGLCAGAVCCVAAFTSACQPDDGQKKPEKLKDGIAVTLTEGGSTEIDIAQYISLPEEGYSYSVESSSKTVVSVTLNGSIATLNALSQGEATVTASADAVTVEFPVTVNESVSPPDEKNPPVFEDMKLEYDLKNEDSKTLTLAPVSGESTYVYGYSLKTADEAVTIEGNELTAAYTAVTEKTLTVIASYTDSANPIAAARTVEFDIEVNVTDTRDISDINAKYKVSNGSFDNDLTGWTLTGDAGSVSEESKFWADANNGFEGYPVHNVGKYFAGNEAGKGTLASSLFEVGGINKITFMLGAAKNTKCYITLENADDEVLEIWRNTKFADLPAGTTPEQGLPMIGETVFALNLVTYVADLSEYEGETVRIILHDEATEGFGFINFDELVTFYENEADLPAGATSVENQLADKSELNAALQDEITEQGDYTPESFTAYTSKVTAAKEIAAYIAATQNECDKALTDLQEAVNALALRVPKAVDGAETIFSMLSGSNITLNLEDYVDEDGLSKISYDVSSNNPLITVGQADGKNIPLTAGATTADSVVNLTISVKYGNIEKLSIVITVTVTAEPKPVLKEEAVTNSVDVYTLDNKQNITLDFAHNVSNPENLSLTYEVTDADGAVTLDENNTIVYNLNGNYSDIPVTVTYTVTVKYGQNNSSLTYDYTLNIIDTTAYRIKNGGFENGLENWVLSNNQLGAITEDTHYWLNDEESASGYAFGNDGKFFSAYAGGEERAMGTLTSSSFTIGGSGYITYKIGAAKHGDKVYLDVIEESTGAILGRFYNDRWQERTDDKKSGCTLIEYKVDLSAHKNKTVYIRITDNAIDDYGLFFVDSFMTYYKDVPATANTATGIAHPENIRTGNTVSKYQVYNGNFETGNLEGWTCVEGSVPGRVSNNSTWYNGTSYNKVGTYLFAGGEGGPDEADRDSNLEHLMGTIRSDLFTLKANAWVSFKLGGAANDVTGIRFVKADGTVLAQFHNTAFADGTLVQYVYQFSGLAEETECYIEIYDNATSGWGLVNIDEIITDYDGAPAIDGATTAKNQIS